jgi:hypothetical protein
VAKDGSREPLCPGTGLTVPECSCSGCLEAMLRELHPELLSAEIRVSRPQHSGLDEQPQR